jgi:hypothetical protein
VAPAQGKRGSGSPARVVRAVVVARARSALPGTRFHAGVFFLPRRRGRCPPAGDLVRLRLAWVKVFTWLGSSVNGRLQRWFDRLTTLVLQPNVPFCFIRVLVHM